MISFLPLHTIDLLAARLSTKIRRGTWSEQRDALGICLGLHGLCVSEVCRSTVARLDPQNCLLEVPRIKRRAQRIITLDETLVAELVRWRNGSTCPWLLFTRPGNRIFPTHLQRFARIITAEVLGESFRFHAFRHTFAVRLYQATKDILLVQMAMGHNDIKSTLVYARTLAQVPPELSIRIHP